MPELVGKDAPVIAKAAGFDIPKDTKVMGLKIDAVGKANVLNKEIMGPIVVLKGYESFEEAVACLLYTSQRIPCNPCESSCPFHAITIGEDISNLPELDADKCVGCGSCITHCSGLACFVLDKSYSDTVGSVSFPYEYLHDFKKGDRCV